jgi:hypothetical protein
MSTNLAVSLNFGSLSTYVYPGGYDQDKLGLGPLMWQANDTGTEGQWVGPLPNSVIRPWETTSQLGAIFPDVISWSSTIDWVVLGDNSTAAATRRFGLFTYNKAVPNNPWSFIGVITVTPPTATAHTAKGHCIVYEKYVTGTVTTNGTTALVGDSTTWSASRLFVGSRIGIGSTDPTQITTWYEIGAIGSDTSITLTQAYTGANAAGQSYVIEDLRILFVTTNATLANGGLFMAAGLRYENFTNAGTTIVAAVSTDKVRAVYWLSDGNVSSNGTNQAFGGIAIDTRTDWTHQNVYACDMAAGMSRFQVSNFRAAMTLNGSGRDGIANTLLWNTGQQAVTGTVASNNNLVLCTPGAGGGPRSGRKSLFWVTTTRIYSAEVSNVTNNSVNFQSGCAVEMPPGSTTTYGATSALSSIAYSTFADCFLVLSTCATAFRSYVTRYREDVGQWDRLVLVDTKQLNQSTEDTTAAIYPNTLSLITTGVFRNGLLYLATHGILATTNFLYSSPFAADWEYVATTNSCVVTPVMDCSKFTSFVAAYFNTVQVIGGPANPMLGRTGTNLGSEPGAVRMYYRTSGISDNSGAWTLLDYSGNMSQVSPATQIQAKLEFRVLNTAIPARVTRICFEGSGAVSDNHFQFSQGKSSSASKQFVFRYSTAFGTTVPTLYIRLYDGITNNLLVSDDSVTKTGTWEKTTNGTDWDDFDTADRANETTYLRYTPVSLADNVNVLPILGLS